ncbi:MAG: VOC family protein [Thermoleophilaceae bacterium]|nr:VOC family protein [Thermoleophilaceae bacterium]
MRQPSHGPSRSGLRVPLPLLGARSSRASPGGRIRGARRSWRLFGPGPRHELFVHVEDVDTAVAELRDVGSSVLREPADMPWGERVAFVADPEGNVVSLAAPA